MTATKTIPKSTAFEIAGVSYPLGWNWLSRGLVREPLQTAKVVAITLASELRKRGLAFRQIRKMAQFVVQENLGGLREHFAKGERYLVFETVSGKCFLCTAHDGFQREDGSGFAQFVIVDLQIVVDRVCAALDGKDPSDEA